MILLSTGAIITRANGRNPRVLFDVAPKVHADGFEFMMYDSWYEQLDTLEKELRDSGLSIPVLHMDKSIGELLSRNQPGDVEMALARFERNCVMAERIGASMLVLHLWGGVYSDYHMDTPLQMYDAFRTIARRFDRQLTVENVICAVQDPMTHFQTLRARYPDIAFTFDTKMADFHRQMDQLYRDEWQWLFGEGFVRHLHVNDYGGEYKDFNDLRVLPAGEGHIDLPRFLAFVRSTGYAGHMTMEGTCVCPDGTVDIPRIERALAVLRTGAG